MTADELYAMEAETGRTSEWEPLYRAEKARADEALRLMRVDFDRARAAEDRADAAEAAVARVRAELDNIDQYLNGVTGTCAIRRALGDAP